MVTRTNNFVFSSKLNSNRHLRRFDWVHGVGNVARLSRSLTGLIKISADLSATQFATACTDNLVLRVFLRAAYITYTLIYIAYICMYKATCAAYASQENVV